MLGLEEEEEEEETVVLVLCHAKTLSALLRGCSGNECHQSSAWIMATKKVSYYGFSCANEKNTLSEASNKARCQFYLKVQHNIFFSLLCVRPLGIW